MVADPDDVVELRFESVHTPPVGRGSNGSELAPSHILLVGWNALAPQIITELGQWVAPDSLIRVIVDETLVDPGDVKLPDLKNIDLLVHRRVLIAGGAERAGRRGALRTGRRPLLPQRPEHRGGGRPHAHDPAPPPPVPAGQS